jgi:hypothetical protein
LSTIDSISEDIKPKLQVADGMTLAFYLIEKLSLQVGTKRK